MIYCPNCKSPTTLIGLDRLYRCNNVKVTGCGKTWFIQETKEAKD